MTLDLSHIKHTVDSLQPSSSESERTKALENLLAQSPDYLIECTEHFRLQNNKLNEEITTLRDDRSARKYYGIAIFGFVALYIFAVMFTIWCSTKISDMVLMTLLGSTSINIIGLLMGVVRYLFPNAKK